MIVKTSFYLLLGALVLCVFSIPNTLQANPHLLVDAADHHVSAQGNYKRGSKSSWEWKMGSRVSAPNQSGINASGLLAVHRLSKEKAHLDSALKAASVLIKKYKSVWKNKRPYTQDIEFLANAGHIFDAISLFKRLKRQYRASEYVKHVLANRKNAIGGWDIASAIRAAVICGDAPYANELLNQLIAQQSDWDKYDRKGSQYLAAGSLLWAISKLKMENRLTQHQTSFYRMLKRRIDRQIAKDGALKNPNGFVSTQTMAYALIAYVNLGDKPTATRIANWINRHALTDKKFFWGGKIWSSHYLNDKASKSYYGEVQSEVLMALAAHQTL